MSVDELMTLGCFVFQSGVSPADFAKYPSQCFLLLLRMLSPSLGIWEKIGGFVSPKIFDSVSYSHAISTAQDNILMSSQDQTNATGVPFISKALTWIVWVTGAMVVIDKLVARFGDPIQRVVLCSVIIAVAIAVAVNMFFFPRNTQLRDDRDNLIAVKSKGNRRLAGLSLLGAAILAAILVIDSLSLLRTLREPPARLVQSKLVGTWEHPSRYKFEDGSMITNEMFDFKSNVTDPKEVNFDLMLGKIKESDFLPLAEPHVLAALSKKEEAAAVVIETLKVTVKDWKAVAKIREPQAGPPEYIPIIKFQIYKKETPLPWTFEPAYYFDGKVLSRWGVYRIAINDNREFPFKVEVASFSPGLFTFDVEVSIREEGKEQSHSMVLAKDVKYLYLEGDEGTFVPIPY